MPGADQLSRAFTARLMELHALRRAHGTLSAAGRAGGVTGGRVFQAFHRVERFLERYRERGELARYENLPNALTADVAARVATCSPPELQLLAVQAWHDGWARGSPKTTQDIADEAELAASRQHSIELARRMYANPRSGS